MMTSPDIDIVDKLRFWQSRGERHSHGAVPVDYVTLRQAADEIVKLRAECRVAKSETRAVENLVSDIMSETGTEAP